MEITEKREARFKDVIAKRQNDLTVVLENVHDPHNIGAVMRSCDSVGVGEIYILNSEEKKKDRLFGLNSSSGSFKWIKIHYFEDVTECFSHIKSKYDLVVGTHLAEDSKDLYDLDLSGSVALVFGNEHDGMTKECLKHIDINMIIPQAGMVQSLNISVACAVTLYESLRQRKKIGKYDVPFDESQARHQELYDHYLVQHKKKFLADHT